MNQLLFWVAGFYWPLLGQEIPELVILTSGVHVKLVNGSQTLKHFASVSTLKFWFFNCSSVGFVPFCRAWKDLYSLATGSSIRPKDRLVSS
jgi:hypothetical protein